MAAAGMALAVALPERRRVRAGDGARRAGAEGHRRRPVDGQGRPRHQGGQHLEDPVAGREQDPAVRQLPEDDGDRGRPQLVAGVAGPAEADHRPVPSAADLHVLGRAAATSATRRSNTGRSAATRPTRSCRSIRASSTRAAASRSSSTTSSTARAADWKIIDVNVLGVWLVENYRNSFQQEVSRGGIDGLIKSLTAKNQQLSTGAGNRRKG